MGKACRMTRRPDHTTDIGPAPCDTCPLADKCETGLACIAYLQWITARPDLPSRYLRTDQANPSKALFVEAFSMGGRKSGRPSYARFANE